MADFAENQSKSLLRNIFLLNLSFLLPALLELFGKLTYYLDVEQRTGRLM